MKKFTVYAWIADDEGGLGVCLSEEFTSSVGYHPESGWRAKPSEKIGESDTMEELAEIISADDPMCDAMQETKWFYDNCSLLKGAE
jgi:hypothetical protein